MVIFGILRILEEFDIFWMDSHPLWPSIPDILRFGSLKCSAFFWIRKVYEHIWKGWHESHQVPPSSSCGTVSAGSLVSLLNDHIGVTSPMFHAHPWVASCLSYIPLYPHLYPDDMAIFLVTSLQCGAPSYKLVYKPHEYYSYSICVP